MNKENCVIYTRVSSKRQVDEGTSLEKQEIDCVNLANKLSLNISKIFIEKGESAKTADRTALTAMMDFCSKKSNNVKFLIMYKSDRLARNTEDYLKIKSYLYSKGVKIKSVTENFEDTPSGKLQEVIMAGFAQYDNEVRTERVVNGSKQAVLQGRVPGTIKLGYVSTKDEFGKATIGPQPILAPLIRDMFIEISKGMYSLDEIHRIFYKRGLCNQNTKKKLAKSYFNRLIRDEIYCGWINKFGLRVKGKFTPVVEEEIFRKAQRVISGRSKPNLDYKYDNPDFPLRRFVKSNDGISLTGSWSSGRSKKYANYRFGPKGTNYPIDEVNKLWAKFQNELKLDEKIISKLELAIERALGRRCKVSTERISELQYELNKFVETETKLIEMNIAGKLSDQSFELQMKRIQDERVSKQVELDKLTENSVPVEKLKEHARLFLLNPNAFWTNAKLPVKQKLQWFQFPEGVSFDGKNFGTTKIASIYKVKEAFLPLKTSIVGDEFIFWNQIAKEISFLNSVINS